MARPLALLVPAGLAATLAATLAAGLGYTGRVVGPGPGPTPVPLCYSYQGGGMARTVCPAPTPYIGVWALTRGGTP